MLRFSNASVIVLRRNFWLGKERCCRYSSSPIKFQLNLLAETCWVLKDEPQQARTHSLTAKKRESLSGVNVDSKLESFGREVLH